MISKKIFFLTILVIFSSLSMLYAMEINDGNIRLVINEKNGNFSMYYLTDPDTMRYEPLFNNREPRASFWELNIDGNIDRLGRSRKFDIRTEDLNGNPVIVYESGNLEVRKIFTPTRTGNSNTINGVNITVTVQNTDNKAVSAGLRVLIDTNLGERRNMIPFITNNQVILNETRIEGTSDETYWISRGNNTALMGSIVNPLDSDSRMPDYVIMANWKRLNKAKWDFKYSQGRSFNNRPYSIRDSAVCYYFENATLEAGQTFTYDILLSTEDIPWYSGRYVLDLTDIIGEIEDSVVNEDPNLLLLYSLQETLNRFIAGEIYLEERDLEEIESTIERLKSDYN